METKVWSRPRLDLVLCLSSDGMRSHPEIPHRPHLLSIWPAAPPCRAVQQQRGMSQGGGELKRWGMRQKRWYMEESCGDDSVAGVISWFVVNLSCKCIVSAWTCDVEISSRWWYLIAPWSCDLQDASWWPKQYSYTHPASSGPSFLCPGCMSSFTYPHTSNLYQPLDLRELIILTSGGFPPSRVCACICAQMNPSIANSMCCTQHVVLYLCQGGNRSLTLPVKSH